MNDRGQYSPGPAGGAEVRKEGEKWTLILVRELRHSPEKVWEAITEPAHLREWAPFDADGSLGTVGNTVKLTTVGAPTQRATETTVSLLQPIPWHKSNRRPALHNGKRLRYWDDEAGRRHAPDALDQHRPPLHLHGRCWVAHLFRCSGSPSQRSSYWPDRGSRCDEVRRLAAIERRVRKAVRR